MKERLVNSSGSNIRGFEELNQCSTRGSGIALTVHWFHLVTIYTVAGGHSSHTIQRLGCALSQLLKNILERFTVACCGQTY